MPLALSGIVLVIIFWALWPLDMPLVRFVRSLHNQWLESLGNLGNRLGSGWVLVAISAGMLGIGFASKQRSWRQAGLQGLIAHAAAGVVVQGLKHVIGRPRPRFAHSDQVLLAPSWDSGLDSFPSGHAAASLAVAAVIARHFPRVGWVAYGLACGVAVSRVIRGSHFPTDVLVGATVGFLLGSLVANPIRQWRESLGLALVRITPFLVGIFALLWTMTQVRPLAGEPASLVLLGSVLMAVGIGFRLTSRRQAAVISPAPSSAPQTDHKSSWLRSVPRWANGLIVIGVALTTGSLLVTVLVALVTVARRLAAWKTQKAASPLPWPRVLMTELLVAGGLGLAVVLLQGLKGVLPFR